MCANQGRYLTMTVFAFFCSICSFIFTVPPPIHTHTDTHICTHTHIQTLSHTHTFHFALKQVGPRNAYSVGYERYWSLKTRICSFSPHCRFPSQISGGKKWKNEEGRKGNHGISLPAQQCRLWETEGSCSLCAGISPAILLKLRGAFLSLQHPRFPPFFAKASCCDRTRGWWSWWGENAAR